MLVKDCSADSVFQDRVEHILVKDLTTVESNDVMVELRNMNVGRFFLGAQPVEG